MKPKLKKNLTIKDFQIISVVTWDQIEHALGKRRWKQFKAFMSHQTAMAFGCFPSDLDRFLSGLPIID